MADLATSEASAKQLSVELTRERRLMRLAKSKVSKNELAKTFITRYCGLRHLVSQGLGR